VRFMGLHDVKVWAWTAAAASSAVVRRVESMVEEGVVRLGSWKWELCSRMKREDAT
jgi:hypothetical protein